MHKLYLVILPFIFLCGCSKSPQYRQAAGNIWGTTYHITYKSADNLDDSILSVMHAVDMSLSPFQPNSLISAVNRGDSIVADTMLSQVMTLSKQVNVLSHGMFDPTVAPLVNLWGFGYSDAAADRPTQAQIDSALCSVGIADCYIDSVGHVVSKSSDTQYNFSAIAKGYGVDRIADMLRRNGCTDFLVEVGGEIALSGHSPWGEPWRIQVDAPISDPSGRIVHQGLRVMQLTDVCIATSGNYRNHRTTSEGTVGHTISPVTGYPVMSPTLSATIVAQSTALADALATSVMAMPIDSALMMLQTLDGISAIIVTEGADGEMEILEVPAKD